MLHIPLLDTRMGKLKIRHMKQFALVKLDTQRLLQYSMIQLKFLTMNYWRCSGRDTTPLS